MKLVSPNDLLKAACDDMLHGSEPVTAEEWGLVFNHFACNISPEVQPAALKLMNVIYGSPLPDSVVEQISAFQIARKVK